MHLPLLALVVAVDARAHPLGRDEHGGYRRVDSWCRDRWINDAHVSLDASNRVGAEPPSGLTRLVGARLVPLSKCAHPSRVQEVGGSGPEEI